MGFPLFWDFFYGKNTEIEMKKKKKCKRMCNYLYEPNNAIDVM